ncbi:MAG TPA: SLC13 family permease [Candidatus Limnocylindria bacterium]|jgi:anion transporter
MARGGEDSVESLLRGVPYLRDLDRVSFARLIGALEDVTLEAGALIAAEGAAADALYLLQEGEVRVTVSSPAGDVDVADMTAPAYFGELGLLLERRTGTIRAVSDVKLWRLPHDRFETLVKERPEIALSVAKVLADLLDRRQRTLIGAPLVETERPPAADAPPRAREKTRSRVLAAAAAIALPFVLWWVPPPAGLDVNGWRVIAILLGAALAWLLEPAPDFVIALAMAGGWGVTGLAPLAAVLSGFASSSWVLALGALALAGAMVRTGLLFRAAILALRWFPATHLGQVLALVLGGLAVTPLVPLSVARVAAVAPLALELSRSLGYAPRSKGSAGLAFAGLAGYWYFSNVFLTGFATNFFVLGLLPAADQQRFGWIGWLLAAAPAGIVCLAGAIAALVMLFRPEREARVSSVALHRQHRVLGPLSTGESIALAALAVLIVGLIVQPVLGIEPAWFAVIALVVVTATILGREQFRTSLDWGFLIFFGILLGSSTVLQRAGVDRWMADVLLGASRIVPSPQLMVLLVALLTIGVRLVLPSRPTMILLGLALVPSAAALGVDPWVAGFVILSAANTWILPYQGLEYLILRDATKGEAFDDAQGMRFGAALATVRVVAIAASIPVWSAMGLVRPP